MKFTDDETTTLNAADLDPETIVREWISRTPDEEVLEELMDCTERANRDGDEDVRRTLSSLRPSWGVAISSSVHTLSV